MPQKNEMIYKTRRWCGGCDGYKKVPETQKYCNDCHMMIRVRPRRNIHKEKYRC